VESECKSVGEMNEVSETPRNWWRVMREVAVIRSFAGRERRRASWSAGGSIDGMESVERSSVYWPCASPRDFGCTPGPLESIIARLTIALSSGTLRSYAS
jgi:hypothetical protein